MVQNRNEVPEIPIVIGGRERHLRLDMNAMVYVEEETGINLLKDAAAIEETNVTMLRILLWACLVHEDGELDGRPHSLERAEGIREVGSWLHPGNFAEVGNAVMEAVSVAMPAPSPTAAAAKANGKGPKVTSGSNG